MFTDAITAASAVLVRAASPITLESPASPLSARPCSTQTSTAQPSPFTTDSTKVPHIEITPPIEQMYSQLWP